MDTRRAPGQGTAHDSDSGWEKMKPAKVTEQSGFEAQIASFNAFFKQDEATEPSIHEAFAKTIDKSLRRRPNEEALKAMNEQFPRPDNIPNLQVPRVNADVYEQLNKGPAIVDASIQRMQQMVGRAISIGAGLVDQVGDGSAGSTESHLEEITAIVRGLSAAFSTANQIRKEVIRNDLTGPLTKFCTWETPVGTSELFGVDLNKRVEERDRARRRLGRRRGYR